MAPAKKAIVLGRVPADESALRVVYCVYLRGMH